MFAEFGLIVDYLGIVIPIGISAAATTLMCLGKSEVIPHWSRITGKVLISFHLLFARGHSICKRSRVSPDIFYLTCITFAFN